MTDIHRGIHFEKLDGSANYTEWKFAMRMHLIERKLWKHVEAEPPAAEVELAMMALAVIVSGVKTHIYTDIQTCNTGKQAWDRLSALYETSDFDRKVQLLTELVNVKFTECKNMDEYVQKKIAAALKLQAIGTKIDDEVLAGLLLANLPESFQPLIMALKNCGSNITPDLVRTKLVQEANQRASVSNETALFASGSNRSSVDKGATNTEKKSFKKGFKGTCNYCGKFGHKAAVCRKKKADAEKKTNDVAKSREQTAYVVDVLHASTHHVTRRDCWLIDSGASAHMTPRRELLVNYRSVKPTKVQTASGELKTVGMGDVTFNLLVKGEPKVVTFLDVYYVPGLTSNLLSVRQLAKRGLKSSFDIDTCEIREKATNKLVATGSSLNEEYSLDVACEVANSAKIWHRRLGHLNERSVEQLRKGLANGMDGKRTHQDTVCEGCAMGKQHRDPFPTVSSHRAKQKLEVVHSDLCGPMPTESLGGARYVLTFIDDLSRMTFVYLLKAKCDVFEYFKEFRASVEKMTGTSIKVIRTDNGTEYMNRTFMEYLKQHGIQHQTTAPFTAQQNGVAERANRTLMESARSMLLDAKLPKQFWAEAVSTACYLKNRSPTSAVQGKTPIEVWTGEKPDLKHLRIFGCTAYAHIPREKRKKLDPKSKKMIFVGYSLVSKAYRLYDRQTRKIIISRDVLFHENNMCSLEQTVDSGTFFPTLYPTPETEEQTDNQDVAEVEVPEHEEHVDEDDPHRDEPHQRHELRRNCGPPTRLQDYVCYPAVMSDTYSDDPQSVKEALSRPDAELWQSAMDAEFDSLMKCGTWEVVQLPVDRRPLTSKWVFKIKRDANNSVERYKARLVVRGCEERYGIDYIETFSPVARIETIRILLALATKFDWEVDQMDIVTAYLHGDIEEEIYMYAPESYADRIQNVHSGQGPFVCRLKRPIYGLKQAGRAWHRKLDSVLQNLGFRNAHFDPCVYYQVKGDLVLIITVYVDDLLLFSNQKVHLDRIKARLQSIFEMKDLGPVGHYLGMRLTRDRGKGTLTLDQSHYINKMLKRFKMEECKPIAIPVDLAVKMVKPSNPVTDVPYQAAVGSLLYLAQGTRPDISYAVGLVSQFNNAHNEIHWTAVKRIMRYLRGTTYSTLTYSASEGAEIQGFSDSDWGNHPQSITGYAFTICGGAVCWRSKKQSATALSSTEAEYMALTQAAQEAIWLKSFLQEIGLATTTPMQLFCDNQGAIALTKNAVFHARTKHIAVKHHFIRQAVNDEVVQVYYLNTKDMPADFLTKGVPRPKHEQCARAFGLSL